ncbi:hypothetical protein Ancab_002282 [Ancistrocladus abbreviatus]
MQVPTLMEGYPLVSPTQGLKGYSSRAFYQKPKTGQSNRLADVTDGPNPSTKPIEAVKDVCGFLDCDPRGSHGGPIFLTKVKRPSGHLREKSFDEIQQLRLSGRALGFQLMIPKLSTKIRYYAPSKINQLIQIWIFLSQIDIEQVNGAEEMIWRIDEMEQRDAAIFAETMQKGRDDDDKGCVSALVV